jgi:hypothetical protein
MEPRSKSGVVEAENFRERIGIPPSAKLEFMQLPTQTMKNENISILTVEGLKKSTGKAVRLDVTKWPKIQVLVDAAVDVNIDNAPKINYEVGRCIGFALTAKEYVAVAVATEKGENRKIDYDRLMMDKQAKRFALSAIAPEKEVDILLKGFVEHMISSPVLSQAEAAKISDMAAEKVMKQFGLPRHASQDVSMAYFAGMMHKHGFYVHSQKETEPAPPPGAGNKSMAERDALSSGKFKNDTFMHMLDMYKESVLSREKQVEDIDFNKLAQMSQKEKAKAFERER